MLAMLVMEIPTGVLTDRVGHIWSYRLALLTLSSGGRWTARGQDAANDQLYFLAGIDWSSAHGVPGSDPIEMSSK